MPWSDPHTEAPALWALKTEWLSDREEEMRLAAGSAPVPETEIAGHEGSADEPSFTGDALPEEPSIFECSCAPLDASDSSRRGMESFLLYRYRQESGESPLCSLGRFPARYRRSSTKKEGRRGGKLADGQKDNPAGGPSQLPLIPSGIPGEQEWMGLAWSAPAPLDAEHIKNVHDSQGLYLLLDGTEVILIGKAENISSQLAGQAKRAWEGGAITFSYHAIENPMLPHQLRELETDLVGNYYEQYRKSPVFQFRVSSH